MRQVSNETFTLTNGQSIVSEKQITVGLIMYPDETDRYGHMVPVQFPKTITTLRSYLIQGLLEQEHEEIYKTSGYMWGLDALDIILEKKNKLKIGTARVLVNIQDTPVVIVKNMRQESWNKDRIHYILAPGNWIDCSTKEGNDFLEQEIKRQTLPLEERLETAGSDKRNALIKKHYVQTQTSNYEIYNSNKSNQENIETMKSFLSANQGAFNESEIKDIINKYEVAS